MRGSAAIATLTILIVLLPLIAVPPGPNYPVPHAQSSTAPTLEVVSPGYGNNITNMILGVGSTFTVDVNVTNAGPIVGFDITLEYGISPQIFPVLSTTKSLVTRSAGLFDGTGLPAGCSILVLKDRLVNQDPFNTVGFALVLQGVTCTPRNGTGRLFSVTFNVIGVGAASLNIQLASSGRLNTLLIGPPPDLSPVPNLQVVNGYFRNKAGVPPVAKFTYAPLTPLKGKAITFNGTQSFDPENNVGPQKGISKYLWNFGDNSAQTGSQSLLTHIFLAGASTPAAGYFEVSLVVNDTDNGIPARQTNLVHVSEGIIHDVAATVTTDKSQVNVGTPVQVTVAVSNRGNRDERVTLTVTYDYQGSTAIANPPEFFLAQDSPPMTFNYTLQTTDLPPRVYQITALAQLRNATNVDPYNPYSLAITVLPASGNNNSSLSLNVATLTIGVVIALAALGGTVYALRRRRNRAEEAEDRLA